ncbi:hypothetical protein [Nostocoides sp. HKS02]|uniref:hypothetical protein n=1 Tax=Nostocoides sp. HKS02 TaxID=1813880 RepID=UPI0012B4F6EC|nr:hypothetical protein [Tetrasphaera sp. HKS02]QGN58862.1 hypothetical protein GKE56_14315 [Tetrasphaera sp. HKS02]
MRLLILEAASTDPLWERIVVAAVGPAVTVLVGGLVVWWITSTIQHRRQRAETDRAIDRAEAERARAESREEAETQRAEAREDAQRTREERARDDALRHELVGEMSDSAASLYLMTQHYMRAKEFVENNAGDQAARTKLEQLRPELDSRYLQSRTSGDAIEHRLSGFFASDAPRQEWHRVQDLLSLRYFQLIERATPKLYEANKGPDHSGLQPEQMTNPKNITNAYRVAITKAVDLVFTETLREPNSGG